MLVLGTRPEAIKLAPVAMRLAQMTDRFETVICSTGQHREMLTQALAAFGLQPHVDLQLMRPGQALSSLLARAIEGLDETYVRLRPDVVIVQGDTTSALAGALAAYHRRIPTAHLEAGLRTGDLYSPFPEEGNRRLISTLASVHFAPTSWAAGRLSREGLRTRDVLVTGNTVIDALLYIHRQMGSPEAETACPTERTVLVTMHRRESYGAPFERICRAISTVVQHDPSVRFLLPMHPAPNVQRPVRRLLAGNRRVALVPPMAYPEFVSALSRCHLVLTDSGGVQEEAPALAKPVLILRKTTERPEAIRAGTARLVGTSIDSIVDATEELLNDAGAYERMARAGNPFGDGQAAERVVGALSYRFGLEDSLPAAFYERVRLEAVAS